MRDCYSVKLSERVEGPHIRTLCERVVTCAVQGVQYEMREDNRYERVSEDR